MADTHTPLQRSYNMSRIRNRDTKPEIFVRSLLHRLGYRFRKNVNTLPGKPDIVLRKYNTVIFVHGCFWHQHAGCKRATTPKNNQGYWGPKLKGNVARDQQNVEKLRTLNWSVLTIWECETKDEVLLAEVFAGFFSASVE
jgi:DNA mismatch endonuclease, patch repair protein